MKESNLASKGAEFILLQLYELTCEIIWLGSYICFKSLFALSSNKTWLSVGDDGLIVSNVWFMHSDAKLQHQLAQSHGKLA